MIKGFIKRIYYVIMGPTYRRAKAEVLEETQSAIQSHLDRVNQEVERIRKISFDHQGRVTQQVSEEFIKMYKLIDDVKSDRVEVRLNAALVDELIKIHTSLEALKHERNGRD